MSKHLTLGKQGELLAKKYLIERHYEILATNYVHKRYELDIIALKDQILIFVEVKTRSTDIFGSPEDAVGFLKEKHITEASEGFILKNDDLKYTDIRFDIISVIIKNNTTTVNHIEDAFFPRNF